MDLRDIPPTTKARVLLEALPYLQRFAGSVFVVKYGGSFMDDPDPGMRHRVATDLIFLATAGIRVVVVHGGGKAISRAMDATGRQPRFEQGYRVTDAETVEVVRRTLDEEVNGELCALLAERGGRPRSLPGSGILRTRRMNTGPDGKPFDIGFVGEIEAVETAPIEEALAAGEMPIVSPVGADASGQPYNTNADVAAGRVAGALGTRRLVYLCDVPGLLRDPADPATLLSSLAVGEVAQLKREGVIAAGMLPKVDSAVRALQEGVRRVHFVDGRQPHSLLLEIYTDQGVGTEIVS